MVKTWEDVERYRQVIADTDPDGVVECGTFSGKSALWFARHTGRPVVTIDIHNQVSAETRADARMAGVTFLRGASDRADIHQNVLMWCRDHDVRRPLVVLDSDHSAHTVRAELELYAPLVAPGGYCVVEDTIVRWMPWEQVQAGGPYHGSPLDAVEAWLRHPTAGEWENDAALEGMHPATQFPGGWLRRTA